MDTGNASVKAFSKESNKKQQETKPVKSANLTN